MIAASRELTTPDAFHSQLMARLHMDRRWSLTLVAALLLGCNHMRGGQCVTVKNADSPHRGFIVVYKSGVDVRAATDRFAAKYSFTPRFVWTQALNGFAADFTPGVLAGIRCEPEVKSIEHDPPGVILLQSHLHQPSVRLAFRNL